MKKIPKKDFETIHTKLEEIFNLDGNATEIHLAFRKYLKQYSYSKIILLQELSNNLKTEMTFERELDE